LEEEASTVKIQKPKPSLPAVKAPPPTEAAPKTEASSAAAQAAPTDAPPPAESPKPLQKLAIVIDDEPANRDFLTRLIAQASYTTKGAASGKEAISLTEELDGAPMVIVIDSELPDTSGMELLRRFRPLYPQTKIIMATMHDNPSLIHEAFAAGCNAFVVKPHGFMDLFKRLQVLPGDMSVLEKIVFDRYGVREFKGSK
jgi:CheY-like chemotaxis protein